MVMIPNVTKYSRQWLLAVDPGYSRKNATGFALFLSEDGTDQYTLKDVQLIRTTRHPETDVMYEVQSLLHTWVFRDPLTVAVEVPELVRGRSENANDVLRLESVNGAVWGAVAYARRFDYTLSPSEGTRLCRLPVSTWKGRGIPKAKTWSQVQKALWPTEHAALVNRLQGAPLGVKHNVIDAVGIGLYVAGRITSASRKRFDTTEHPWQI